jgi:hypothetical protein
MARLPVSIRELWNMLDGCSVIELKTRRKIAKGTVGARSAARIAADLGRAAAARPLSAGPEVPLTIRLEDLTGISDATVDHLTRAAATGLLTVEAAARLAIRHAQELGGSLPTTRPRTEGLDPRVIVDLEITGDLFGEFALRIGPSRSGLVVAFAPVECFERLGNLFGADRSAICIVSGRTARFGPTAGVFAVGRCVTALKRVVASKRWRFGRFVLLIGGGVPDSDHWRRAMAVLLETAIRHGGVASVVPTRCRTATSASPDARISGLATEALQLIELAFPGLVATAPDGRSP